MNLINSLVSLFTIQAAKFVELLKSASANVSLDLSDVGVKQPCPPVSLQSFIKAQPDIPGVVLTNHRGNFTNRLAWGILGRYPMLNHRCRRCPQISAVSYHAGSGRL